MMGSMLLLKLGMQTGRIMSVFTLLTIPTLKMKRIKYKLFKTKVTPITMKIKSRPKQVRYRISEESATPVTWIKASKSHRDPFKLEKKKRRKRTRILFHFLYRSLSNNLTQRNLEGFRIRKDWKGRLPRRRTRRRARINCGLRPSIFRLQTKSFWEISRFKSPGRLLLTRKQIDCLTLSNWWNRYGSLFTLCK